MRAGLIPSRQLQERRILAGRQGVIGGIVTGASQSKYLFVINTFVFGRHLSLVKSDVPKFIRHLLRRPKHQGLSVYLTKLDFTSYSFTNSLMKKILKQFNI